MIRLATALLSVLAGCEAATADNQAIVGTWKCSLPAKVDKRTSDNSWTVTYTSKGTYTYDGSAQVFAGDNVGELEITGDDEGTFQVSNGLLISHSENRTSAVRFIRGPIVEDEQLQSQIELYLYSRDQDLMSSPYQQKIDHLDDQLMRLIPLTEPSKEMVSCTRAQGSS